LQAAERLQPHKAGLPAATFGPPRPLVHIPCKSPSARLMACHEQRQDNLGEVGLSDFHRAGKIALERRRPYVRIMTLLMHLPTKWRA
jgi:hypothetical protein